MWDADKWEFTRPTLEPGLFPPWMDARHVEMLYCIIKNGNFKNILEIGCWNGNSSAAILQGMIDAGNTAQVDFCDIEFRPKFREVLASFDEQIFGTKPPGQVRLELHEKPSREVISPLYDCIIVDGDHQLKTVAEELELLMKFKTHTIIAHDTQANVPWCDGSRHLANVLKATGWYCCIEDSKYREGEATERGFLFLTQSDELMHKVLPDWQRLLGT